MRMLLLFLLFIVNSVYSEENVLVTAVIDNNKKTLNVSEAGHVLGNIAGHLSTCIRYERVVGKPYDLQASLEGLEKLKSENHLNVILSKNNSVLPIRFENIAVDEIYVGFSESHFPITFTVHDGNPQSYAKCMGDLSIINFKCDKLISELFKLNSDDPLCKIH